MSSSSTYYERYWRRAGSASQAGPYIAIERLFDRYVEPQAKWIDLGCGDAATAGLSLERRGVGYKGVDISAVAADRAISAGFDVGLVSDLSTLPFAAETFDGALILEVLEHLFEPQVALVEAARVIRPGGILIATVPNAVYWRRRAEALVGRWDPMGDELSRAEPWRDPHIRFYTQSSFHRLLMTAGFDLLETGAHWGTWLPELPVLNKLGSWRRNGLRLDALRRSSAVYMALERRAPSLLGFRLHVVARRRSGT